MIFVKYLWNIISTNLQNIVIDLQLVLKFIALCWCHIVHLCRIDAGNGHSAAVDTEGQTEIPRGIKVEGDSCCVVHFVHFFRDFVRDFVRDFARDFVQDGQNGQNGS